MSKRVQAHPDQLVLWPEEIPEFEEHVWPVRWADGDTSVEAICRMFCILAHEQTHHLCGYAVVKGGYISFYANILEVWVESGVIHARGLVHAEGRIARAMMEGRAVEEEPDED